MRTSTPKPAPPSWYIVDASGQHLGRLATHIAHILRGKHKPTWSPHMVMSDHVIVTNATQIVLTGKKADEKVYHRHSGYFGSLKKIPVARVLQRSPEQVITRAVRGMLPRNRLRPLMMNHLHVFADAEHQHEAQQPQPLSTVKSPQTSPVAAS